MIKRQNWVDHKFNLGIAIGWTQNVLSRVQDTIIRIEHHCKTLSDLEELWSERFQELPKRNTELIMADMSNQKTKTSNHNQQSLATLLNNFRTERKKLLSVYNALNEKSQNHQAMHPRIKMLMRPVDLLFL